MNQQEHIIASWPDTAPIRRDPPAACIHCIYHRIADAVEVWAQLSLPADRDAAWAHVSDLLNLKNTPP